jgi:DNA-binding NarL/FixJ family response regulator
VASTVALVDDHDLIRQGLRRAFERDADFEVIADLGAVTDALTFIAATPPDVVIVDLRLGDGSGLEVVRAARAARPEMGIVVLTMYAGDEQLFEALEAGASAFVSKDTSADEVVAAARHAVASPRSFSAADLAGAMDRRMNPTGPRLSRREQEVLDLLAEGLSVSAIAGRLYISESTAKTHIAKLYEKLGASNRASAIMAALKAGLIESPGAS